MNDLSQQIAQLRRDYVSQSFDESLAAENPFVQFQRWFEEAMRAEQPDVEAMTLSTATREGRVSARIVLLKGFDERGFVFFTNYDSRKSRELAEHPERLPEDVDLYLMPMLNPDGAEAHRRFTSTGADLNRDHLLLAQPETQALHRVARRIQMR